MTRPAALRGGYLRTDAHRARNHQSGATSQATLTPRRSFHVKQETSNRPRILSRLSNGSTKLADGLKASAPPGIPVAAGVADDVVAWDEDQASHQQS